MQQPQHRPESEQALAARLFQHVAAGIIDNAIPADTDRPEWIVDVRGMTTCIAGELQAEIFLAGCDAVARGESHPQLTSPWVRPDGTVSPGLKVHRACYEAFGPRRTSVPVDSTRGHIAELFGELDFGNRFRWTIVVERPDRSVAVVGILEISQAKGRPAYSVVASAEATSAARAVADMIHRQTPPCIGSVPRKGKASGRAVRFVCRMVTGRNRTGC